MSKAVMLSVRPKWCEKIASGEKTIEVRKTKPNLETPFKCYVYRTKGTVPHIINGKWVQIEVGGTIIAEFTCDRVETIKASTEPYGIYDVDDDFVAQTRLVDGALWDYGKGATLYGWHISKLKIYDTPKELTEFRTWKKCKSCSKSGYESTACIYDENCMVPVAITKAPQSWCYVEGNVMGRLWDYCAFCGKRIETGEKCYGLPNGESVCTDCCVEENEGAAVSNGEEEQEG